MSPVTTLVQALAPWKSLYSDSKTVASVVTGVHLVGLLFGGGLAVAADRLTLRAMRRPAAERAETLRELHAVHRPVLVALALLFVSGVALAAADAETFLGSPIFWAKLGVVALLLANGAVLERTERALRQGGAEERIPLLWRRLGISTRLSLALWTATVVMGTVLVNAA
jgi:hypothetical protein